MSINIASRMAKKRIVRNMNGDIIDLIDDANGGIIISKGRVVNQDRWNEMLKQEEDRKLAAQAAAHAVNIVAPDREAPPSKVDALEKKVEDMGSKLDAILKALQK